MNCLLECRLPLWLAAESQSNPTTISSNMATFVWTAKDPSGQTVVKEVQAGTSTGAHASLQAEGYTDLVLKEEDFMSASRAGFKEKPRLFGEKIRVTAGQRLQHRDKTPTGFASAIWKGIMETKFFCLLMIGLAVYVGYQGHWMSVGVFAVALLAWLAFLATVRLSSVYYYKLNNAADWNRWDEVLSLVDTLDKIGRFSVVKVPLTELIRQRANALAGQGHLTEALREYQRCEGRPECPGWLYKTFVGSLYNHVKQYDKAIEYSLMSIAENPTAVVHLDLANRYARYKRDPVKAREALENAEKMPIVDVAKPYVYRCHGIIAYLEGKYTEAKRNLENAIEILDKIKSRPGRDGHLSIARAYLCCVLAKQGDLPAAKTHFAQAKEYLVATKEDALLAECLQLIGEA
jgi:tetratricopeptide (TPR) repeat protein